MISQFHEDWVVQGHAYAMGTLLFTAVVILGLGLLLAPAVWALIQPVWRWLTHLCSGLRRTPTPAE